MTNFTMSAISIHEVRDADREWVLSIIRGWGADFIVSRGRKIYASQIDGFIAEDETRQRAGLVTFEIIGDQCEIVTLDAFQKHVGIGTALIERVRETAIRSGCRRLWLITTNDNIDALRFYQKRGFIIAAVHARAIEASRKLKPSISLIGNYGIPIRDEIELEMDLRARD